MGRLTGFCAVVMLALGMRTVAQVAAPASPVVAAKAGAAEKTDWQADIDRRRLGLIARNGPGTDKALAAKLLAMQETDQQARGIWHGTPVSAEKTTTARNLTEVDAQLTAQLKEIVAKSGWPTIALVGIEASNAAMLVLTHTRDKAWQAQMLPELEGLADGGKIDGSALAVVIDKELVREGQLQRYGTQFKYLGGDEMALYSVEDPAGLDARRAKVFLPPLAVEKQQMEAMYHMKATDKVVMAAKP
jgi:hypothetical protein